MAKSTEMAVNCDIIDFTSEINDRAYRLLVSVPASPAPPEGYPVLYLIDANLHFGIVVDTARIQGRWPDVADPVIVGIGYQTDSVSEALELRSIDLSAPPPAGYFESGWRKGMPKMEYGGVEAYLDTIEKVIFPLVEKRFPTDPANRVLTGHSLGGLTTLRAAFTRPGLFRTYGAVSPSIWMGEREVLQYERGFVEAMRSSDAPLKLHLSAGAEESRSALPSRNPDTMPMPREVFEAMVEDCAIVEEARDLAARLEAEELKNLELAYEAFEGFDHNDAPAPGFARVIRFAFRQPA